MEDTDSLWRPLKGKAERKRRIARSRLAYLSTKTANHGEKIEGLCQIVTNLPKTALELKT